jgi:hypothetical protein
MSGKLFKLLMLEGTLPELPDGALATFTFPELICVFNELSWIACTAVSNTKTTSTITIITFLFIFWTSLLVFRFFFIKFLIYV